MSMHSVENTPRARDIISSHKRYMHCVKAVSLPLCIATILVGIVGINGVSAQEIGTPLDTPEPNIPVTILIELSPKNPRPGEEATATLRTSSIDVNRSDIAWLENDELVRRGFGQVKHTFTASQAGFPTKIGVIINSNEGYVIERELVFYPATVDLSWEAQTAVPPFYKGKSLYSPLSKLHVIALPNIISAEGTVVDPKTLVYTWKQNNTVLGKLSGYGKQSALITDPIYRLPTRISVTAATEDNLYIAESSITINSARPTLLFYQDHPTYGVLYNKSLGTQFPLKGTEMSVLAFPYFFEASDRNDPKLTYSWYVNNAPYGTGNSTLALRGEGTQRGVASLYLEVKNAAKIFEAASARAAISF